MKVVYPVLFLSTALLFAACSDEKKTAEAEKAEPVVVTTEQKAADAPAATEQAAAPADAPAATEQAAVPADAPADAPAATEQAAAPADAPAATEQAAAPADAPAVTEQAAATDEAVVPPATTEQAPPAEPEATEPGSDLAMLGQYIGKYPNDGVNFLTEAPIADRLDALLGEDFARFQEDMDTVGPLSEDGRRMFITGNKKGNGGKNAAALVIDPEQDALFVWMLVDGVAKTFAEDDKTIELPADVKAMMDNAKP